MASRSKKPNPPPADNQPPVIPDGSAAAGGVAMVDELGIPKVGVKPAPKAQQVIAPSDLAPDMQAVEAMSERFKYWVGIHPDCPVERIGAAGLTFQKVNELLVPDAEGKTQRVPVIGGIANIDRETMLRLTKVLPRIVIRFLDDPDEHEEPGTGLNVGDAFKNKRRGQLITIPKPGDKRRKYYPQPNDRPAINWMFMQLCADQDAGSRGTTFPESIAKTGLAWHGDPLDL